MNWKVNLPFLKGDHGNFIRLGESLDAGHKSARAYRSLNKLRALFARALPYSGRSLALSPPKQGDTIAWILGEESRSRLRGPAASGLSLSWSKSVYVPPYNIAIVYAGLGDKDQAFAWLERAFEERSGYLTWLTTDPQLDNLRSDPRFADLLRRVGLQH